jgi:chemotaxis signal transduction protein
MENQKLELEEEVKTFDNIQLVGFKLGQEIYATDVMKIEEIIRYTEITAVPRTENYVLGVMNLRGKVIPVVDLRVRFNLDKFDFDKDTCIIVVNFDNEYIGFVVDSVTEVMRVNRKMINPNPPLVGSIGQEYILGICRYNENLVFILDIDRVVFTGKKYKESDLKKIIQGSDVEKKDSKEKIKSVESTKTELIEEQPKTYEKGENQNVEEAEDSINVEKQAEVDIKDENKEADKEAKDTEVLDKNEENIDIDELIREELAKREKETEELIQKKRKKTKVESDNPDLHKEEVDSSKAEDKLENSGDGQSIDALMEEELKKQEKKEDKKEKKKEINNNTLDSQVDVKELKEVAKKIIEGNPQVLDQEISKELASVVSELREAKSKYETFINNVVSSRRTLPKIQGHLKDINEITTQSTDMLFNVIDSFNHFYEELLIDLENIKKYVDEGNKKEAIEKLDYYDTSIKEYISLALKIYEALEFEDIASQKIDRVLKLVSDVTARFGSILGYIKNKKKSDYVLLSQEEINNILKNMGLE